MICPVAAAARYTRGRTALAIFNRAEPEVKHTLADLSPLTYRASQRTSCINTATYTVTRL